MIDMMRISLLSWVGGNGVVVHVVGTERKGERSRVPWRLIRLGRTSISWLGVHQLLALI